jgi:hypothetical protein
MSSRSVRLGLSLSLGLALMSGASWAQQINRGPLQVVRLRAPDGDGDAATTLSTGMREAARAAGYEVSDATPSFDQEFAMVGCSSTSPECLSQIAGDIHAQKFIYGSVTRIGRGRNAQLSVEVSLWDETTHREVHREAATLPLAQAQPNALRTMAQQMFVAIGNRDMQAQQEVLRTQQEEATRRAQQEEAARRAQQAQAQLQQAQQQLSRRTTIQRSHVLRYVGLGVLGLGVVSGVVGVVQLVNSQGQANDALNGQGDQGLAWARYDNEINPRRSLSVSDVCSRAATDAANNADAAVANNLCDANSTARAMAYAFGIGGVVIAGVGAALVVIDALGSSGAQSDAAPTPAQQSQQRRTQMTFSPVIGQGVGGMTFGMTF